MSDISRIPDLARLFARQSVPADLLGDLHRHALAASNGVCSVLLQIDPRTGRFTPTSCDRLAAAVTGPWLDRPEEAVLAGEVYGRRSPRVVAPAALYLPSLDGRWPAPIAVLVPVFIGGDPEGLLIVGTGREPDPSELAELSVIGDAFSLAIERLRSRRERDFTGELQHLFEEFSTSVTAQLSLGPGLDIVTAGLNRLLGADRTSIWLHQRRMHRLALAASSDQAMMAQATPVSTADPDSPAAFGMRRERAELHPPPAGVGAPGWTVTAGLKGRRRALGTLVVDGLRVESPGAFELLARVDEVARQLSSAIETTQLLEEVLQSRRQLENTFNSLADLVAVCDGELRVVQVNQAFARQAGANVDAIVNRSIGEFVDTHTLAWLQRVVRQRTRSEPVSRELTDAVLTGTFFLTVTALAGDERHTGGSVLVARNITAQAQLAAERSELRDRLAQSEKLAALGQFVAGIAHELNNPLQGVLGYIELLRRTGAFPPAVRRDMQLIYREADRAAKIVRNLLLFAGSPRLRLRRLNVNLLVARALALRAAPIRAGGIEIVRRLEDDLPRVRGDALMLQQALLNVIVNAEHAIVASGRPGRLTVRTRQVRSRSVVAIQVEDTGGGIPPESLPRIFEPFFTTKDVGQGTGLGLAITYGIIQEHGGAIRAANRDVGAVFTLELPVEAPPSDALK